MFVAVVVLFYLAFVLIEFLRGAEQMHRHPRGGGGFIGDLALALGWVVVFFAVAGIVLLSTDGLPAGLLGDLILNGAGLAGALVYSFIPQVRAARVRLKALRQTKAEARQ